MRNSIKYETVKQIIIILFILIAIFMCQFNTRDLLKQFYNLNDINEYNSCEEDEFSFPNLVKFIKTEKIKIEINNKIKILYNDYEDLFNTFTYIYIKTKVYLLF